MDTSVMWTLGLVMCPRLTASVQKFSSSVDPFSHSISNGLAIPFFFFFWLSVSHPCACRAFACRVLIPKEHLHVRSHVCYSDSWLCPFGVHIKEV